MKGHVRRRGSAWELRAYAGIDPTTRRQKYVPRTFRGDKREAEEALARLVTGVSGGGHRPAQLERYDAKSRPTGTRTARPFSAPTVRQVHAIARRPPQQGVHFGLECLASRRACLVSACASSGSPSSRSGSRGPNDRACEERRPRPCLFPSCRRDDGGVPRRAVRSGRGESP